ncbi:MAG: isoleucine--tRNA ligase [Calditrichaeota bacterium]|nr:isoleucine--tRNA ligase [Calditrichota bacterium]RQV99998.1 MAG: isoleucine--tRNA ligase [Calditrichota bacterium]
MFRERLGKVNVAQVEEEILDFWKKNQIFLKSLHIRENAPHFVFYEGPPTANGRPGIHHVMSRTIKDVVCRYKTMKGFRVDRKAGWDTHGLPVEIEVEKMLNIEGKEGIEDYGISKFNQKCRESVFNYKKEWDDLTKRIGFWLDLENPYITFENEYIETIWWILNNFFERNLIYKGFKILPYCPRCETPLSSHEVSQGYREVTDPSVYIRFRVTDEPDTSFLVWTTTPWTLISNVALAVHPDVEYLKVNYRNEKLILAEPRADAVLNGEFEILERYKGRELEHLKYEPLYTYIKLDKEAFYTILGDFVTTEDGTGIVHIAPAFGEDDYNIGLKYSLPVLRPVNQSGEFDEEITDFKGYFVKEADPHIIENLKNRKLLFRKEMVEHSYPHCWRCDSPLLYYARDSWYIRTTQFKDKMLANNAQISWYPPEVGEGRFGEWLNNNVDWALSRDRYWGTPLNIWVCQKCEHAVSVPGIEALRKLGKNVPEKIDLHKPYVDDIIIPCEKCGSDMKRVPEVIDVWFDSGSMPYAQWHYPFGDKEIFEKNFPADFICEGVDQTRGWFYSLLAISTLLFDKPAFKNIVVNELILDKDGQKMSKSKGNVVVPQEVINKYGVDPLRWYFVTVSAPWVPKRFDIEGITDVYRKFFDTLFNTYGFFALYANIDKFDPDSEPVHFKNRPEIDRWVLSLLYSTIGQVNEKLENYDMTRAARIISDFLLDDVSNWYVRRNRRRFWKGEMNEDKLSAFQTLYEVLLNSAKLIAPMVPFVSDDLYRNMKTGDMPESVHLASYPELSDDMKQKQDADLENRMRIAQQIVSIARSLRNDVRLKVRQPLQELIVASPSKSIRQAVLETSDIIREEINIKKISTMEKSTDIVLKKAKPIYKQLGPKVGKLMKLVAEIIENLNEETIRHLEETGEITLDVERSQIHVSRDDVEIYEEMRKENLVVSREGNILVALNTEITPELEMEGIAREFVNRIQNLRKEAGFEVTDRISVFYEAPEKIHNAIEHLADYIMSETLAVELNASVDGGIIKKEISINGINLIVSLEKKAKNK